MSTREKNHLPRPLVIIALGVFSLISMAVGWHTVTGDVANVVFWGIFGVIYFLLLVFSYPK